MKRIVTLVRTFIVAAAAFTLATPAVASADATVAGDVLIQAGHEGRPDCDREKASVCNNTGAPAPPGEIRWTPIVANEATRVLRAAGVTVLREPAYLAHTYAVRDAVFVHFDGSETPCATGASVGYKPPSKAAADAWKALYKPIFPFAYQDDNFTDHLANYYGFKHVIASDGAFVLEFGEMSCPAQHAWLEKRLTYLGDLLAHFLSVRIGKGNVPMPAPVR